MRKPDKTVTRKVLTRYGGKQHDKLYIAFGEMVYEVTQCTKLKIVSIKDFTSQDKI